MPVVPGLAKRPTGRRPARLPRGVGSCLSPVRRIGGLAPPPQGRVLAVSFLDGPTAAPPNPPIGRERWRGNSQAGRSPALTPRGPGGLRAGGARAGGSPAGGGGPGDSGGITGTILDILRAYGARATFAVIGTTALNYPDEAGPAGSPYWNGQAYDHFPEYGRDDLAGVVAQPDLTRSILAGGHELANHSYRHIPLGPPPAAARRRTHHAGPAEAFSDVAQLHEHVREYFGYTMRLAQPPYLVDTVARGNAGDGTAIRDVFDIYAALGYDYLGLGVDGGGWRETSGSYDFDVDAMVLGLQRMLESDGQALSGRVVSFRDGYNMSRRSPVVTALPRLMQLFRNYGYKVVSVSELLEMSPFSDLDPGHPAFPAAKGLLDEGWWVASRDNEVRPFDPVLRGELAVWAMGPGKCGPKPGVDDWQPGPVPVYVDVPLGHPHRGRVEAAAKRGFWRGLGRGRPAPPDARGSRVFGLSDPVGPDEFREVMGRAGVRLGDVAGLDLGVAAARDHEPDDGARRSGSAGTSPGALTRAEALVMIWGGRQ